jgi:hypothetical protein
MVHHDWLPLEASDASIGRFAVASVGFGATLQFGWP